MRAAFSSPTSHCLAKICFESATPAGGKERDRRMSTEDAGGPAKSPLWMKLALIASLAVNVAVIGLFAGHLMNAKDRPRGQDRQINWIVRFVPEARQDEARKLFEKHRDTIRTLQRERGPNMDRIIAAIRAEPFSPETLRAAIGLRSENVAARRGAVEEGMIELLVAFDPDERTHFADQMAAQLEARRQNWQKR